MKNKRRLIFHIGDHKTGTTTIQRALANRKVVSPGVRILYPAAMNHNYLRRHFGEYAKTGTTLANHENRPNLRAISSQLEKGDYEFAVISGEEFEGVDPAMVSEVVDQFFRPHVDELIVVCYVRPHAQRTLSSFVDQTKLGAFSGTLEAFHENFLEKRKLHYRDRLDRWRKAFGKEFIVRPAVPDVLPGGSTLRDFITQAFSPAAMELDSLEQRSNEALSLRDLMIVKLVQSHIKQAGGKTCTQMGWLLANVLSESVCETENHERMKLHKTLAVKIKADYQEDAALLDSLYFEDRNIFRRELEKAENEALPEPLSVDPHDYLAQKDLRTVAALGEIIRMALANKGGAPWPGYLLEHRIRTFAC